MVNDWYAEVEKLQLNYIVVTKDGVDKLAEEVNCLIARGYLPQGGISVNSHNIYTQAMFVNPVLHDAELLEKMADKMEEIDGGANGGSRHLYAEAVRLRNGVKEGNE